MRRREFVITTSLALLACGCPGKDHGPAFQVIGEQGLRDGQFVRPRAMGVYDSELYVIDTTGRVQVFDLDGGFKRLWSVPDSENGTPTAINFPDSERVLIPDTHYSRVLEYTRTGDLLLSWGSYGTGLDRFVYPTGIVQAPDKNYYLSEYGMEAERVHVFDPDRKPLRQWGEHGSGPGQFNRAMAIAGDGKGLLYVADTANHRIQVFDLSGKFIRAIGGPGEDPGKLKFPHDLALGPDGSVFACEYGAHRVSRFDSSGKFMAAYGRPGRGPGQFNGPRGVAVYQDRVYVADTDNHRLQMFRPEGMA